MIVTHHRSPVACMRIGDKWQFPIPLAHLTHDQIVGLAKKGLLVVALPPGYATESTRWTIETLSSSLSTAVVEAQAQGQSLTVPAFELIPASPQTATAIKEGFSSFVARAKNAREQYLRPTSTSSASSLGVASPTSPTSPVLEVPLSPSLSVPGSSPRTSVDAASILSSDSAASNGSKKSQWMSWASSKWGR
jgi:hypothetical protein